MNKFLEYVKYLGLFILFILIIAIVTSLINLTGINTKFVSKLGVILASLSFFIVSFKASRKTKDKGYIRGLKLGLIFIITITLINIIIFKSKFSIDRLIYLAVLLFSSVLGGSMGKNFKNKKAN